MRSQIRMANKQDTVKVLAYLEKANLGTEGIKDLIDYFLLMEDHEGEVIATLGIEPAGECGLLRSLAISPAMREADILKLFNRMLELAKQKTLSTLYLATNRPESLTFFEILGFKKVETENMPDQLVQLNHVQHILTVDNSIFMEFNL